jgi:hypothetical protein
VPSLATSGSRLTVLFMSTFNLGGECRPATPARDTLAAALPAHPHVRRVTLNGDVYQHSASALYQA